MIREIREQLDLLGQFLAEREMGYQCGYEHGRLDAASDLLAELESYDAEFRRWLEANLS